MRCTTFQVSQNPGGSDPSSVFGDNFDDGRASAAEDQQRSLRIFQAYLLRTVSVCASEKTAKSRTTAKECKLFIVGGGGYLRTRGPYERVCLAVLRGGGNRHARQITPYKIIINVFLLFILQDD